MPALDLPVFARVFAMVTLCVSLNVKRKDHAELFKKLKAKRFARNAWLPHGKDTKARALGGSGGAGNMWFPNPLAWI